MKIATWNVNSLKVRLDSALAWLGEADPDVVCLQEIKLVDDVFPRAPFEELGYNIAVHGQKTYNGVAILSKFPLEDIRVRLPGNDEDDQARYVEALIASPRPVRVASIYLPNGNPVDSPKYPYKLAWMARLKAHAYELLREETALVLAGDYNVIPAACDARNPDAWVEDALFRRETRLAFNAFANLGLTDAFRACNTQSGQYSFWDYQAGAWQRDLGIRIDHLMLSAQAADRLEAAGIDKDVRGRDKPSDHVPVWCVLAQ